MHFRVGLDSWKKNIIIETDEPLVENQLKGVYKDRRYSPWLKKWIEGDKTYKIYNRKMTRSGMRYFEIGIGWISYILSMFKNYILQDDYNNLMTGVYRDTYRQTPFPELRDYQNSDVLHVLKYRRALFSVFTGFGEDRILYLKINKQYKKS